PKIICPSSTLILAVLSLDLPPTSRLPRQETTARACPCRARPRARQECLAQFGGEVNTRRAGRAYNRNFRHDGSPMQPHVRLCSRNGGGADLNQGRSLAKRQPESRNWGSAEPKLIARRYHLRTDGLITQGA